MTNKRNMMLETVGTVFLVTRYDVKHSRRCTSEGNEHHYGFWRMILQEFNMEQLIRIVMKTTIRWQALFESRLVISRWNPSSVGTTKPSQSFSLRCKLGLLELLLDQFMLILMLLPSPSFGMRSKV